MASKKTSLVLFVLLAAVSPLRAADPENCLSCHRYRGLGRVAEDGRVHLYHIDPDYYDRGLGPHARLRCSDCHPRDEVYVVPHKPVTPVNCTTTCHLSNPMQQEVQFSHEKVATMLQDSVHPRELLAKSNDLLGKPLHDKQSSCLLCHTEPTFQRADQPIRASAASVSRCNVCHGEELPVPMGQQFMFWHVHARSEPARSNIELVKLCSRCHSNDNVLKAYQLHDTTASYLASFHGKAMQLGSRETAGCLDCHVGELQNIHLMKSHTDPLASTSQAKLPDTCRSSACHPGAGAAMSTAAVHLDIATGGGIEYIIAALFVLMILSTFGPSVVLQSLEMVQFIVGRHDPRQHEREHTAERLMRDPVGRKALTRFTIHQRVQHWILAICFTALCVTGFPIKFADRTWASWAVTLMGGLSNARALHRIAGVVLMVGFFYHFCYIIAFAIQQKRASKKSWIKIVLDLPMVTNPTDIKQLFQQLGYLFFLRKTRPELGRFSLKEKFEYFGVFWGSALLGVTGILMWFNAWTTQYLTGRVLTISLLVHGFEAFLALLHVGIIHMIGVIFSPVVFPLSPAMFSGDTPAEELAEAHAGYVDEAARTVGDVRGGGDHV